MTVFHRMQTSTFTLHLCLQMILKYCDMFLKLKDLCDTPTFKEVDMNNDGTIFPKDFKAQLEKSKKYTKYDKDLFVIVRQLNNLIVNHWQ